MSTTGPLDILNFEHTVRTITARIHAAEAFLTRMPVQQFGFSLKAAAGSGGLALPQGELLAPGSLLGISIVAVGSDLQITLQLKGFKMLKEHGGKAGRLVSTDGKIHVSFRFDSRGTAVCYMTDSEIARAGLEQFRVEVFDDK